MNNDNELRIISEKMLKFLEMAENSDKPIMTHLGYYTTKKRIVTLWAGYGEENPMERIEQQNKEIAFYIALNKDLMEQMKSMTK